MPPRLCVSVKHSFRLSSKRDVGPDIHTGARPSCSKVSNFLNNGSHIFTKVTGFLPQKRAAILGETLPEAMRARTLSTPMLREPEEGGSPSDLHARASPASLSHRIQRSRILRSRTTAAPA